MRNWKTTVAGILGAFLGIVPAGTALLASIQSIESQIPGHAPANYTLAIIGAVLSFLAASARVWIGLLQNDAPDIPVPTIAITPGTTATTTFTGPTSTEPKGIQ